MFCSLSISIGPAHDARGLEGQALDALALDRVLHFGGGREDARAVDLEARRRADQAEFHRVPVEARQKVDLGAGFQRALAVHLHVVGEHRVAEQRHVAEEIVEQVGLDQVVELGAGADPHRHRKAPMRQVIVEHRVGDQARHADDAPAGQLLQPRIDRREVGDAVADAERLEALHELIAGVDLGERRLPLDQQAPHGLVLVRVVGGALRHRPVGRHACVVAAKVFQRGEVHAWNMGTRAVGNPGEVGLSEGPGKG